MKFDIALGSIWIGLIAAIALVNCHPAHADSLANGPIQVYSEPTCQKADKSGLAACYVNGAQTRALAVFLCLPSVYPRFMVKLEGDTFACAGLPFTPVGQPPTALPPSLGRDWQSSVIKVNGVNHD